MKSLVKDLSIIGVVVLMLLAGNVFASNPEGKIKAENRFAYSLYAIQKSFKFRLAFDNPDAEKVSIKIYDQNHHTLYNEVLTNRTELKQDFDLSAIGSGEYTVKLKVGEFESTRTIKVGEKPKAVEFKSYISPVLSDKESFQVAYENNGEDVYITIADANDVILYSEHTQGEGYYSRRFNLSELRHGEYKVSLTCGEKTIERTLKK